MEVRLGQVSKSYQSTAVVHSINLKIKSGSFHFLLGPSGCGKTTILRMIAGLEKPSSGKIFFGDRDVTNLSCGKRNVGMVFQNYALWPHMTVEENIVYGLKVLKTSKAKIKQRLEYVVSMTRLEPYLKRYPSQLSGGQQQRVALSRALAIKPDVLLLDEPLSNLDAKLRLEMRENIARIHKETNITTIYVTHDQKEALSLGDNISLLYSGEEIQTGSPRELYNHPCNSFVAGFIGETNLLRGTYLKLDDGLHSVKTPFGTILAQTAEGNFKEGDPIELSIRPEAVKVKLPGVDLPRGKILNVLKGKVSRSSYFGEMEQLSLNLSKDKKILVNLFNIGDYHLEEGADLDAFFTPKHVVVLPEEQHMGIGT